MISDYHGGVSVGAGDQVAVVRSDDSRPPMITIERLDGADGSLVTRIELATPPRHYMRAVVPLPDRTAVVGYRRRQDPATGEVLVGKVNFVELYDLAGAFLSKLEFAYNIVEELEVARDPRGGFVIAGWDIDGDMDLGLGPIAAGETAVIFLAHFDDEGALVSQHLAPDLVYRNIVIGDDGAVYATGGGYAGDPWCVLARADETGAIEWCLGIHGRTTDRAGTFAAGIDGDVMYAAGHLEGAPGFGLQPDPAASGTDRLPPDQPSFLVSIEAATGAVRWQRGLERQVESPLVADDERGMYLFEGFGPDFLVARED